MRLNLYLLSQNSIRGTDYYDRVVVAAKSPADAITISPYGKPISETRNDAWPNDPAKITVELIGRANDNLQRGVILASWNGVL